MSMIRWMVYVAMGWAMVFSGGTAAIALENQTPETFTTATTVPTITQTRAVRLACAYTGLSAADVVSAHAGMLTDPTILFYHVKDRLA